MMLSSPEKKVLVQCAIAAINHRLFDQAAVIERILPLVVEDPNDLQALLAVMDIGRGNFTHAAQRLEGLTSPEAVFLRLHLQELIHNE